MVEYGKMEDMADLDALARALFLPTLQTLPDKDERREPESILLILEWMV